MVPLRDVYFPFLLVESIQSLSPGLYKQLTQQTFLQFRLHTYVIDNAAIIIDYGVRNTMPPVMQ